uniref:Capsid protein VP1 n=2 Tax=Squirrel monkey polyomavirus TaxID=452475 RepID=A0A8F6C782_POVSM|nr:VP1 [Squirrel monkey polyomavirus]
MPLKKRSASAPRKTPQEVPRLLISGGVEVLGLKTGPDSITEVEAFLNPRMGLENTDNHYGYSENVTVAKKKDDDKPLKNQLPCYSVAKIELPMLNEDLTNDTILMWECISVKTEVVGINTLVNTHSYGKRDGESPSMPIVGLNYHFFAVGGEPIEMQYIVQNFQCDYPVGVVALKPSPLSTQVLDPKQKSKLTGDGIFPIECWAPDPSKNENARYFATYTGGLNTPPVLNITNTVTTILLNENGVGPLCKGDQLHIAAADICGFHIEEDNKYKYRGLPRYFKLVLRKRVVKNPYPVSTLLNTLFTQMSPNVQGQDMTKQVEEVKIYEGTEKLPGDPDMIRFRNQFGQEETVIPVITN